jgi:Phage tail sheath protein.|nr:MAG TPA: tail sheath protein [Caudoviricetes sp.]
MGLPEISVYFKEKGIAAIESAKRGIILLLLNDASVQAVTKYTVFDNDDIPETLSEDNKKQIELALIGYQTTPYKIVVLAFPKTGRTADINAKLKAAEALKFTYLVYPEATTEESTTIATWIKAQRTQKDNKVKAVLYKTAADNEGIINVTNEYFEVKTKKYTGQQYLSRIAGLICGTPATIACTFAPLPEVTGVEFVDRETLDSRIDNGEFVVFDDGEKIKVARGVNSYVTTVQDKGKSFKKIKLVELMDMVHDDIKKTAEDNYLGKYANSYDNRCLLITAINGYFLELEAASLAEKGKNNCSIDVEATKVYLMKNGRKTKEELKQMKEIDIKYENIGDNVFLTAEMSLLDAIETIKLPIHI